MAARFIVGDTLDVLRSMPDASVDLVLTSPPFLALRSYLPNEHPDKAKEIGSESTPGAYLDVLLDVLEECGRVLAPHGSIAFELGDTYAGSGGGGGDYNDGGQREGQPRFDGSSRRGDKRIKGEGYERSIPAVREGNARYTVPTRGNGWPDDKSLCLMPHLLPIALSYGFNPLTGRECSRWRVRNVVAWCRPNPPIGALGDKYRPAVSYITIACKSKRRYFDVDAVRLEPKSSSGTEGGTPSPKYEPAEFEHGTSSRYNRQGFAADVIRGVPPLDYWEVPTRGYSGAHYATWPEPLLVVPIQSMTPHRVCRTCGEPSRRIAKDDEQYHEHRAETGDFNKTPEAAQGVLKMRQEAMKVPERTRYTVGWTNCGHNNWRRGVVLDPFGGSGTTGAVANGYGRDAVLIDIDERNAWLARERMGMFLEVEQAQPSLWSAGLSVDTEDVTT